MYTLSQFPLPYATDELAPYMSAQTLEYHHGRHLATYIKNLNDLIADTPYAAMPLMQIIRTSSGATFNNAAQVFNHDFFFHCLRPAGGGEIPAKIADQFGGADNFRARFKSAALSVFGSGWVWLIIDTDGKIKITTTANADTPIAHGGTPLMTLDVWEHAYYLDYQNRRAEFIDVFLDRLVNWDFVLENVAAA